MVVKLSIGKRELREQSEHWQLGKRAEPENLRRETAITNYFRPRVNELALCERSSQYLWNMFVAKKDRIRKTTGLFRTIIQWLVLGLFPFVDGWASPPNDSLEVKAGQMIMVGFRGMTAEEGSPIGRLLKEQHLGGVILFDYDVETKTASRNILSSGQLRTLTGALQSCAAIPLFIAIDQEGGRVVRLKTKYGFPPSVSQKYLGVLNNTDSTRMYAGRTARTLSGSGINVNFAPVLDVNLNPENPVIGKLDRSFASDPKVVAAQAKTMIDAFHSSNILSAVKHFPGHGSSKTDSHEGFVNISDSWNPIELIPYGELISSGFRDMVMTAHVYQSGLDPVWPASLSRNIITGLLRDSLRFQGVIVSDDLQMKAIADQYELKTVVKQAIDAGVDILLFGNNTGNYDETISKRVHAMICDLVRRGEITADRIDASFDRIMALKKRLR